MVKYIPNLNLPIINSILWLLLKKSCLSRIPEFWIFSNFLSNQICFKYQQAKKSEIRESLCWTYPFYIQFFGHCWKKLPFDYCDLLWRYWGRPAIRFDREQWTRGHKMTSPGRSSVAPWPFQRQPLYWKKRKINIILWTLHVYQPKK